MEKIEVIKSIAERCGGDIYLGVVGAVRTGKSTFIKRFMENLVIPNIQDEFERKRALDETWNNLNTKFPDWKKNKLLKKKSFKNIYMRSVNRVTFKIYCCILKYSQ